MNRLIKSSFVKDRYLKMDVTLRWCESAIVGTYEESSKRELHGQVQSRYLKASKAEKQRILGAYVASILLVDIHAIDPLD